MTKLCIIPARGGSKRIPKKNIKDFLGRPIISYSIKAARESGLFDEVMVSTDDSEIADVAKSFGASVPFMRSQKNSDDFATTSDVIFEVLSNYDKKFDYVCCVYPTAPFVTSQKLRDSFELLKSNNASSVIPVVQFSYPPQRGFLVQDGVLKMQEPVFESSRSQDLEKVFHDVGQFYWLRSAPFILNRRLFSAGALPFFVSTLEAQDIDSIEDWHLAELKYQYLLDNKMLHTRPI